MLHGSVSTILGNTLEVSFIWGNVFSSARARIPSGIHNGIGGRENRRSNLRALKQNIMETKGVGTLGDPGTEAVMFIKSRMPISVHSGGGGLARRDLPRS